ncbi:MAG: rhodanese-like domain-containing protein [Oligoflexia bacterium]|nr:rhodanese-like domain-containing protein [Oligoflexia bacterium]
MFENYQIYLMPTIIILFFGWRYWRFKRVKMRMPELINDGAQIIDVRSPEEFASAANPLSKNIPLEDISKRIKELNPQKPIILCCASGGRSGMACRILKSNGIKNIINAGSWQNTLIENL